MEKIIGRQKQIAELEAAIASDKPEMVAVVGRRRIGKTFLIGNVYEKQLVFELTGVQFATQKSNCIYSGVQLVKNFLCIQLLISRNHG
ncbi:MAG: ATP-binding protein [Haliscomenobacter sp.]|nr:hypothetical protein [Haliscomenobacter sp.]MBK9489561.1 ATP-binding protein [Haliscomenobacter sp.]